MFNWLTKIIISIFMLFGISPPPVLLTPELTIEPTRQILSVTPSPVASLVPIKLSPTPIPITKQTKEYVNQAQQPRDS